ncbi:hypothetical protein CRE_24288 [Caenorhabditis remanei]|uniref:Sdz-33 F-box domain-containing protein n=1 Tax=Caenorhabditis remanei TaxID=31234 RepID=E3NLC1_CAERE|nr:hypothetical protein CRE_24288 [Caenorhabditis remanei]
MCFELSMAPQTETLSRPSRQPPTQLSITNSFISICSKKVSTQINNARLYSQQVIVDLNILSQKIRVHSENNEDTFEIFTYSWSSLNSNAHQFVIAGCTIRGTSISKGIQIFWKNHSEGFVSVIQHLLKMFQCKISTIINRLNCDLYQPVVSELFHLQLEFKKLTISIDGSKRRNLLWNQIANNLGLVEDLIIVTILPSVFVPVFTSWPQNINITSSFWFTLKATCTCTTITLWGSYLSSMDLDEILKKWKTGGFPNLERLEIHSDNIEDDGTMILGMNLEELNAKVIQTDDGSKKATINTRYNRIKMYVTPFD